MGSTRGGVVDGGDGRGTRRLRLRLRRRRRRRRGVEIAGDGEGRGGIGAVGRRGDARDERVPLRSERDVARGDPRVEPVPQPLRALRAFAVEPRQRRLDDSLVAQGDERVRDAPGAPRGGDDARGDVIVGRERDARWPRGRRPDPLGHAARGVAVALGTPRVQTGLTRWAPNRTERIFSEDQTSQSYRDLGHTRIARAHDGAGRE